MKAGRSTILILAWTALADPVWAQKLMLAHVAINPGQSMLHLAKDSGMLAKYGFTAEVLLIPKARSSASLNMAPAATLFCAPR